MKKSKLFIIGAFIALSSVAVTPAKAATTATNQNNSLFSGLTDWLNSLFGGSSSSGSSNNNSSCGTPSSGGSTALPINGNLWFLVMAGSVIGCKVVTGKKNLVAQPEKFN